MTQIDVLSSRGLLASWRTAMGRKPAGLILHGCLAATALLGGCSEAKPSHSARVEQQASEFTDEDRRVARLLSLGNESESSVKSPFEEAAFCEMALVDMQSRISTMTALDPAQRAGMEQAIAVFRARQSAANLSPADQVAARKRLRESVVDDSEWGRVVIGCLRGLQQPAN